MKRRQISWVVACAWALAACGGGGGETDAGPDANDAATVCTVDTDCDNGLFCDGAELCLDGFCAHGVLPDCSDADACTVDRCDEERGACVNAAPDEDGDGHAPVDCGGDDCDDADANRFPGNVEVCDAANHDEDCNPATFGAQDRDGDGFLDARCCNVDPSGADICGDDCDDVHSGVHPSTTEACDGFDNDCDGETDEGVTVTVYPDTDFDGHGDETGTGSEDCAGAVGFSVLHDDCDDTNPTIYTGQVEICDALDNDCDGVVDDSPVPVTWYADADGDGFGSSAGGTMVSCAPLAGYTLRSQDCDDTDAAINPAAAEICDGRDNNCNGRADYRIGVNDFEDDDADGLVDIACGAPLGTDCDDRDAITGMGQPEVCDGRDNNCNGEVDEGAMDRQWFRDADGDGFGSITSGTRLGCMPVPGYLAVGGDCNDADPLRHPGAAESCNGVDDDCDGSVDGADADAECVVANATPACISGRCRVERCASGFGDCDADPSNGCEVTLSDTSDHCGSCSVACATGHGSASCAASACVFGDCDAGYADCDADTSNGCETATRADVNHCGGCGTVCDYANANASCTSGTCAMGACDFGFADCNADPSDGCEVEPQSDPMNCGRCGTVCDGARLHTTAVACSFGRCAIDDVAPACEAGWADCDSNPFNGCETPTDRDPNNCGTCGTSCGEANALTTCSAGACAFNRCQPGFADCDADASSFTPGSNGCETAVDSDPSNCGSCGTSCGSAPNGTNACFFGRCGIGSCATGFDDCDGILSNGCESHTPSDPDNCGACGNRCAVPNGSSSCTGGICSFVRCNPGWADCDGLEATGCEVNTTVDPAHCGSCANDCTALPGVTGAACGGAGLCTFRSCATGLADCDGDPTNGCEADITSPTRCGSCINDCTGGGLTPASTCTGSLCNVVCPAGYMDCNGVPGDGCEIHTDLDPMHCGGCGVGFACSTPPRSTAKCSAGLCGTLCELDYGDCDGLSGNGCETQTSTDPYNCGGCDSPTFPTACNLPHVATPTCSSSLCGVGSCAPGWGNCDGDALNGCETNTTIDPMNCGACGNSCGAGGLCSAGRCDEVVEIAAGSRHTCVLRGSGTVACWGANESGQLGNGSFTSTTSPLTTVGLAGAAAHIVAGADHMCALMAATGDLYCWGRNDRGQLGNGGLVDQAIPSLVPRLFGIWIQVAAGVNHTCGIDSSGVNVSCWGDNTFGQLGQAPDASPHSSPMPMSASALTAPTLMAAGDGFTCAYDDPTSVAANVMCWGRNDMGQLGRGYLGPSGGAPTNIEPAAVVGSEDRAIQLSAGLNHACVLQSTSGGKLDCWGDNAATQLTSALASPSAYPSTVSLAFTTNVYAAGRHTCATSGGALYCWGDNTGGQLATSDISPTVTSPSAVNFPTPTVVTALPVGGSAGNHTCVYSSQTLCWGENVSGQVGDGTNFSPVMAPTVVGNL
ncbi:MAG: hypothetical protein GW913_03445 [Myxococcales bacterium]|nr:hypothetical protein [Myxococcales bacterium]